MIEELVCLDSRHGGCAGEVTYRESTSGTGTTIPRCDQHAAMARERAERRNTWMSGGS
ncbi:MULTISPECIES: hypothetical protein [Streptomyces]|uniref:hypothetical protein n=1 Tax=Streptomyces TaxID=1883 RepID=UPI001E61CB42|nr:MULTISPECIES: hypothetical protein [Streptomyces]UFQ16428.1 hypothetical protein J2N69_16245 [Streptomyces huasconensis]WCL86030.1 hypothetical protein PPN52_16255 [Streptomyces sp. JCM 35825]